MKVLIKLAVIVLTLGIITFAVTQELKSAQIQRDMATVRQTVTNFGAVLKNVSLLAPKDELKNEMETNYSKYVSPDLINTWLQDPLKAPGRFVSSPAPEKINISSMTQINKDTYQIKGFVIETDSTGAEVARRSIKLLLKRNGNTWTITEVSLSVPDTTKWKTGKTSTGEEFKYPDLPTKYIQGQEWPPKITVSQGTYSCTGAMKPTNSRVGIPVELTVNNNKYCMTMENEGAAGSVYTTYNFTTEHNGKLLTIDFVLRFPQCLNYEDPQRTECTQERENFNISILIDAIVGTIL